MLLCTFVKKYTPLYFRQKKHNLSKKICSYVLLSKNIHFVKKICSYIFKHVHLSKLICSYALLSKKNIVNMLFCL